MANEIQIPTNLVPKVWAAKVWTEGVKASYFDKFTDANGNNVIHKNVKLKGVKGDKVYFGLAMNLTGDGIKGNNTLDGHEEELHIYDFAVPVELVRNAVARFVADDQKSPYENLQIIKPALQQWVTDWLDDTFIKKLTASPTTGEVIYASAAGTEAGTTANDKLTCALISRARRKAMLHAPKVNPVKVDGQDRYIMLVSPWAAKDLKTDPVWVQSQAQANVRGRENPIFTGALGEYDGVILYEYERILNTTTGASNANVCHNLLLGKQAACFGVAKEATPIKQVSDYGNREGNGISLYAGIEKSKYNNKDYGVIQVITGGTVEK